MLIIKVKATNVAVDDAAVSIIKTTTMAIQGMCAMDSVWIGPTRMKRVT